MSGYTMGLYGHGMHNFILSEIEVGKRVALYQDSENCGFSAIDDLLYEEYIRRDKSRKLPRIGLYK